MILCRKEGFCREPQVLLLPVPASVLSLMPSRLRSPLLLSLKCWRMPPRSPWRWCSCGGVSARSAVLSWARSARANFRCKPFWAGAVPRPFLSVETVVIVGSRANLLFCIIRRRARWMFPRSWHCITNVPRTLISNGHFLFLRLPVQAAFFSVQARRQSRSARRRCQRPDDKE